MLRRCVATLLLLGFIANQLALVPHAHGGYSPDQQRRHDAVPHVHLFSAGHTHDHDHCGHDNDHCDTAQVAAPNQATLHDPCAAHDGDVVYLPPGAGPLLTAHRQGTAVAQQATWSVCLADPHLLLVDAGRVLAPFHPPDGQARGEKLFVTLRTLRI